MTTLANFLLCNCLSCVRPFKNRTNFQADIISSFLSTVPAGFPLSPGAALAELTGLAPLSPGLGHNPSYHFSMSPRHQVAHSLGMGAVIFTCQDPPSPSRYGFPPRAAPALALHSPRVLSPPRALLDSPHHHLPGSPHDGHRAGRALLDSPHHHLPSSPHHVGGHHLVGAAGSPHHAAGHHLASTSPHPQRVVSALDSPRRYIGSPMRVASRTHSPDLHRDAASPINLHNFHR